MTGRKAAQNMQSHKTNKTVILRICWFYSQGSRNKMCNEAGAIERLGSKSGFRVFGRQLLLKKEVL